MARWEGWNFADGNTGGGRGDDNRKSAPGGGPARRTAGGHGTHSDHRRAVLSGSHLGEWFQEAAAVRNLEGLAPGCAGNPKADSRFQKRKHPGKECAWGSAGRYGFCLSSCRRGQGNGEVAGLAVRKAALTRLSLVVYLVAHPCFTESFCPSLLFPF